MSAIEISNVMATTRGSAIVLVNSLTGIRCIAGPFVLGLTCVEYIYQPWVHPSFWLVIFAMVIAASATDLDGLIAKRLGAQTEFGRQFDPIADGVFLSCVTLSVLIPKGMSVCIAFVYWLPVGLLILYGRAILRMRRRGKVGKPSDLARFNVVVIMGTAGLAIGRLAFQLSNWAEIIVIGALWSAAVIAYFALQDYRETRVCV